MTIAWGRFGNVLSAVALAAALTVAVACSSPEPQTGTNTNWMARCNADPDCRTGTCRCGVCTRACSSARDCSAIVGTTCVQGSDAPVSCTLPSASCLLECTKDADCAASGEGAVCGRGTCARPTCAPKPLPDCRGVIFCGATWEAAASQFPSCRPSAPSASFLVTCGKYRGVIAPGRDGYSGYFYDDSGKLIGHGTKSVTGVVCDAYDPSFIFPSEPCQPLDGECGDASVPPDASTQNGAPRRDAHAPPTPDGAAPLPGVLNAVAATDTGWVAVGAAQGPLVLISSNAQAWTAATVPAPLGSLTDVAFGNATIVAVGSGGDANSHVVTKPPAGAWQRHPLGTNNDQVLFGNGTFLTTAGVEPGAAASGDGLTWSPVSISAEWFSFTDGLFLAWTPGSPPSTSGFVTSANGTRWTTPALPTAPILSMGSLAVVGDQLLGFATGSCGPSACRSSVLRLFGPAGTPPDLLSARFMTSPDGDAGPPPNPTVIASSSTRAVVLSTPYELWLSGVPAGGTGWRASLLPGGWVAKDVAYAHGTFVLVGFHSLDTGGTTVLIATSSDGESWIESIASNLH